MYDDVDFIKWETGELHIARLHVETKIKEPAVIGQNEYLTWLAEKGREL